MPSGTSPSPCRLKLTETLHRPGLRLAVGLSGGADSVALTCALATRAGELGLVVSAAHLHHGLRGIEADEDQAFAADLAKKLGIPFHSHKVETKVESGNNRTVPVGTGKSRETIEEAARRLRYHWFQELMAAGHCDAVATAHTLDDQAETVLGKFLRGAWTEGLSGIHPVLNCSPGQILRPLLKTSRAEVEAYLACIHQSWRNDSSNLDLSFTRNRLRHQLLPELETWNPRIREHLNNMAELAREEDVSWQADVRRLAPQLIMPGLPVRGGGRAATDESSIAVEVGRLASFPVALQRRLLRHAASLLGVSIGFEITEALRDLAVNKSSGKKMSLPGSITAIRTARELRLSYASLHMSPGLEAEEVSLPIPGTAEALGFVFVAKCPNILPPAVIRKWRPGDRVTLKYSSGPRKIKDVLERLKVSGSERISWPVIEWQGRIVWMRGAEIQPVFELTISTSKIDEPG